MLITLLSLFFITATINSSELVISHQLSDLEKLQPDTSNIIWKFLLYDTTKKDDTTKKACDSDCGTCDNCDIFYTLSGINVKLLKPLFLTSQTIHKNAHSFINSPLHQTELLSGIYAHENCAQQLSAAFTKHFRTLFANNTFNDIVEKNSEYYENKLAELQHNTTYSETQPPYNIPGYRCYSANRFYQYKASLGTPIAEYVISPENFIENSEINSRIIDHPGILFDFLNKEKTSYENYNSFKDYTYNIKYKATNYLIRAIEKNKYANLKWALYWNADSNTPNKYGFTPLEMALSTNNIAAINFLLNHSHVNPNKPDKYNDTPLHQALRYKNIAALELLLKHPLINPYAPNQYGNTPLEMTLSINNIAALELLLKHSHVNPNKPNRNGFTPLEMALSTNNIAALELLLKHPLINPNTPNQYGFTPLERALSINNIAALELLLKHSHVNSNRLDIYGDTPLHKALHEENLAALELLLKHPHIDPNTPNKYGFTPLNIAVWNNKIAAEKLLRKHPKLSQNT